LRRDSHPLKLRLERDVQQILVKLDAVQKTLQASARHNLLSPPNTEWSPRNGSLSFDSTGSGPFNATPSEPPLVETQNYQQKEEALGTHPVLTVNRVDKENPKENDIQASLSSSFMYGLHQAAQIPFPFPAFLRDAVQKKEPACIHPTNLPIPRFKFEEFHKDQ
jgi:hypothetical protein